MTIRLNGQPTELTQSNSVADLIDELSLPAPTILVEHNGSALRRTEWPDTPLSENDQIELLRVAAGG